MLYKEVMCKVVEITKRGGKEYYVVHNPTSNVDHFLPVSRFPTLKDSLGRPLLFIETLGNDHKQYLQLANPIYRIGKTYPFRILNESKFISKGKREVRSFEVVDELNAFHSVAAFNWQQSPFVKRGIILCEVAGVLPEGKLKLINVDYNHTCFSVGSIYSFKVMSFCHTLDAKNNRSVTVFNIDGTDGCQYQVLTKIDQTPTEFIGRSIDCIVKEISSNVKLAQTNTNDPFFKKIQDITTDKDLIRVFNEILSTNTHEIFLEFTEQYATKSAFWIFTFCNKILPKLFTEAINRYDYKKAIQLNDWTLQLESWILHNGIIKAFKDEDQRKATINKVKSSLELLSIAKRILLIINKNDQVALYSAIGESGADIGVVVFFTVSIANLEIIDGQKIFEIVRKRLSELESVSDQIHLRKICEVIDMKLSGTDFNQFDNSFNISLKQGAGKEDRDANWHMIWLCLKQYIHGLLGQNELANITHARILRQLFYLEDDVRNKKSLLLLSYHLMTEYRQKRVGPCYLEKAGRLQGDFGKVSTWLSKLPSSKGGWTRLLQAIERNSVFRVQVKGKSSSGFDVFFEGVNGFLPLRHVSDPKLKSYDFDIIDIEIEGKCILHSQDFNFFIFIQEANKALKPYFQNNRLSEYYDGIITEGIVKRHEAYGIFFVTPYGDGLLHKEAVSDSTPNVYPIHYPIGRRQKVRIAKRRSDGGLELSLPAACNRSGIDILLEHFAADGATEIVLEEPMWDSRRTVEHFLAEQRAFIFEQYATTLTEIPKKINYLKLAKQFFSHVKHNRSYFLNIHIEYFQILLLVNRVIATKDIGKIAEIQDLAKATQGKFDSKTMLAFPEAKRLIAFLDILVQFNVGTDECMFYLMDKIREFANEEANQDVCTIAKIALSNNLMIADSEESTEFTLKNLRTIYSYLESGVLSLKELESERLVREREEKRTYWEGRFLDEEGFTLEFKSSLTAPILDSESSSKLEALHVKRNRQVLDGTNTSGIDKSIDALNGDLGKKAVLHSAMKTLCAFANSEGGDLIIGIDDKRNVIGLGEDLQLLKQKDRDGLGKYFDEKIREYFGLSFSSLLTKEFIAFPTGDILIVKVRSSSAEIFMNRDKEGSKCEELYVRNLVSSDLLSGIQLAKFIREKYSSPRAIQEV